MARCELARDCPFFNDRLAVPHRTAAQYKARYCTGSNTECARYIVFISVGRDQVPFDMAPNDMMRARRILLAATRTDRPSDGPPAHKN